MEVILRGGPHDGRIVAVEWGGREVIIPSPWRSDGKPSGADVYRYVGFWDIETLEARFDRHESGRKVSRQA